MSTRLPLIIEARAWRLLESGIQQRMQLLERVMCDAYGPRQLARQGLLPAALLQGHPGYLRAMQGVAPASGRHLQLVAFDLLGSAEGPWQLVSQHCQTPAGLGDLLSQRRALPAQWEAERQARRVRPLTGAFAALAARLRAGYERPPQLALLTPGPFNPAHGEHVVLAETLGLTLAEGRDLRVHNERLYRQTIRGLDPVHGLLTRVTDWYLDPLELYADSVLGVPGLLQAMRAGQLRLTNAPGTAFLDSPALLDYLPAMARTLLGQELTLPSLPTCWGGEPASCRTALAQLAGHVIRPTYPNALGHEGFAPISGARLTDAERAMWAARIKFQPEEYTLQAWPQQPPVLLRVFAVPDGERSWQLVPGGLAFFGDAPSPALAGPGRDERWPDVWVLADAAAESDRAAPSLPWATDRPPMSSRSAENLFWLGRYTQRTRHLIRLAQTLLSALRQPDQNAPGLRGWCDDMAVANTLVLPGQRAALQGVPAFVRALTSQLTDATGATSVGYCLRALRLAASAVRERLSSAHWQLIEQTEQDLLNRGANLAGANSPASDQALALLEIADEQMRRIAQTHEDELTAPDGGSLLLAIGRDTERLSFLAAALARGLASGALQTDDGRQAMRQLFDRPEPLGSLPPQQDLATLLHTLVLETDNPRALVRIAMALQQQLTQLTQLLCTDAQALPQTVPDPASGHPAGPYDGTSPASGPLLDWLWQCAQAALPVTQGLSAHCFHSGEQLVTRAEAA